MKTAIEQQDEIHRSQERQQQQPVARPLSGSYLDTALDKHGFADESTDVDSDADLLLIHGGGNDDDYDISAEDEETLSFFLGPPSDALKKQINEIDLSMKDGKDGKDGDGDEVMEIRRGSIKMTSRRQHTEEKNVQQSVQDSLFLQLAGFNGADGKKKTLNDIILEKLAVHEHRLEEEEQEEAQQQQMQDVDESRVQVLKPPRSKLSRRVVRAYKKIGTIMEKYKNGKVPKLFKIIPTLEDWEEVLYLTRPDKWPPTALFRATKIFMNGPRKDVCVT